MNRIKFLDSVRGLAAISVVIYHVINAHWSWYKSAKFSFLIFNGADAVSLFFVLSGLVLSFKYLQEANTIPQINYKNYIIARFFRLYPVFIVVVLILYCYKHNADLFTKKFFEDILHNRNHLAQYLILVRGYLDEICTPAWTLAVEITVSLLVPILVIVLRVNRFMFLALLPIVFFANKHYISIFVFHFLLGILLAENYQKIQYTKSGFLFKNRFILLIISFLLFSWRIIFEIIRMPSKIQKLLDEILFLDTFFMTGIGAFGILIFIINSEKTQKLLTIKPFVFFGKISYSIYISHWIFPLIFMNNWDKIIIKVGENNMLWVMMVFVLSATIIFSTILYYFVEIPGIKLGKYFIKKQESHFI